MIPLTSTALAHAMLTAAARSSDVALSYLSLDYEEGPLGLLERLRFMSKQYAHTGTLPRWNDLYDCLLQRLQHISEDTSPHAVRKHLNNSLHHWVSNLTRYEDMSLTALSSMLTNNYSYWIIDRMSPLWPAQLRDLYLNTEDSCPPLCLWGVGDPQVLTSCDEPYGIIGSRSVNSYGRQVAFECAKDAALHGHLVISGGALGGDAAAHWGALAALDITDTPGKTVSIMAGGLKHIGPAQNNTLFQRITDSGGAIISEMTPDTIPDSYRFHDRNRLIAAYSSTLIISQAQLKSGAMNTAKWSAQMNRLIYAAPGNINTPYNAGCNNLIHEGKANILPSCTNLDSITGHHEVHDAPMSQAQESQDNKKGNEEMSEDTEVLPAESNLKLYSKKNAEESASPTFSPSSPSSTDSALELLF
ncbi:DNA-processing protein DprA [Alloscardovia macacae]|uniref:DNA processing protein DprA n=1 Tax=Alloscardovia macacae TaxID=1160091 RepID=A0A261F539_9BIFI|nr:DNA-processing protein DprA [Alloscardovia macacae]OZG54208.1 DNA processing protein DprA [Alloscardovia macacae]